MTTFFAGGSKIGVDLNNTNTTQLFSLGTTQQGSNGSIWQYVCAATTVSAYSVVVVNQSGTISMAVLGDVNVAKGNSLAVAQNAFAPSDYGWVPVHGGAAGSSFSVKVSGSVTLGKQLYLATSSGNLSTTAAASATVFGVSLATASEVYVGVTVVACIVTWPKTNTLGT